MNRAAVLGLLLGVVLTGLGGHAQELPAMSVRDALRDNDGNRIPDRLGERVTLTGVLTSDPRMIDLNTRSRGHLQDDTAGMRLVAPGNLLMAAGVSRGDRIRVRGTIQQFSGREELDVEDVQIVGTGTLPVPRRVPTAALHGEQYSGQLVRLVGTLVVPANVLESSQELKLHDASGEIRIYLQRALLRDPEFADRLLKGGGRVEVVGTAEQFDPEPPFDSGYRIVPRDVADFTFVPGLPYRAMAITVGSSLVLAIQAVEYGAVKYTLVGLGADLLQGYLIARPVALQQLDSAIGQEWRR